MSIGIVLSLFPEIRTNVSMPLLYQLFHKKQEKNENLFDKFVPTYFIKKPGRRLCGVPV